MIAKRRSNKGGCHRGSCQESSKTQRDACVMLRPTEPGSGRSEAVLSGIADFDGHLLAEGSEGRLYFLGPGGVFGIEHAADHPLMESQAAGQLGVADAPIAHGQAEREFGRQPQRHGYQALAALCG